jgi:hypothetical protein
MQALCGMSRNVKHLCANMLHAHNSERVELTAHIQEHLNLDGH